MNIIFMGTPDFAVPALKALYNSAHNVTAVFCQPDKPKGRGYKLASPPVKVVAQEYGTPVYQPSSLKKDGKEYIDLISGLNPDCIVVAAYGKILPKTVLDIPKYGCVNIHGSLLPKYREQVRSNGLCLTEKKKPVLLPCLWERVLIREIFFCRSQLP